jgi:hypothetical protein
MNFSVLLGFIWLLLGIHDAFSIIQFSCYAKKDLHRCTECQILYSNLTFEKNKYGKTFIHLQKHLKVIGFTKFSVVQLLLALKTKALV